MIYQIVPFPMTLSDST